MNENDISYIIILIMCVGIAYEIGKHIGISKTIDYFESEGVITFEDKEK